MKRSTLMPVCIVLGTSLSVALIALASGHGAPAPETRSTSYSMSYSWRAAEADLDAEGVLFFEGASPGILARFLIETPKKGRVILTNQVAAQQGWRRTILRDDETGWWIEVSEAYPLKSDGLAEYLREALDWFTPGKTVDVEVRSRGGVHFSASIPVGPQQEMFQTFVDRLEEADVGARLREEVPMGFLEPVAFLSAAFQGADMRAPIETLAGILPPALETPSYADLSWIEEEGTGERGVTVTSAEALDLTTRFGSIDPRHPLNDLVTDELKLERPPAPLER